MIAAPLNVQAGPAPQDGDYVAPIDNQEFWRLMAAPSWKLAGLSAPPTEPAPVRPEPATAAPLPQDPQARAAAEWSANAGGCRQSFMDERTYVAFREAELNGRVVLTRRR